MQYQIYIQIDVLIKIEKRYKEDDKFTLRKLVSIIIGLIGVLFIIGFDSVFNVS